MSSRPGVVVWAAMLCCALLVSAPNALSPAAGLEYSWSEFPDLELHAARSAMAGPYPDWDERALSRAEYSEVELPWPGRKAVLTCESSRDGYLSAIHYRRDGLSRVTHLGLPLVAGSVSSLTFDLPAPDPQDLTRLLLWQSVPEESWLVQLARHPNWLDEPVPGLLAQRWFSRGKELERASPPWEDALRPDAAPSRLVARAGWPLCRATLTADGVVYSKDCAVWHDGTTAMGIDEYGSFGQWVLGWSSRFELVFEVPYAAQWAEAELQLYGDQRALYQLAPGPVPNVTVNGWPVSVLGIASYSSDAQPFALPVSQYLVEGGNHIELRMGSLTSTEWLLDGIELWVF